MLFARCSLAHGVLVAYVIRISPHFSSVNNSVSIRTAVGVCGSFLLLVKYINTIYYIYLLRRSKKIRRDNGFLKSCSGCNTSVFFFFIFVGRHFDPDFNILPIELGRYLFI